MRRKLVKQGPASITVSLPAQWVHAHHLKPGDEVELHIERNTLLITAQGRTPPELTTTINTKEMSPEYVKVLLSGLHKRGFDEIRLNIKPEQIKIIEERITRHLIGYEIIQQSKEQVIIRAIVRSEAEELGTLMRRAFLVTIALADGVAAHERPAELVLLESTNNRLTNYCERILSQNVGRQEGAIYSYIIMWLLEKIADEYRDMLLAGKIKIVDAIKTAEHLKAMYELHYKFSFEKHDALVGQLNKLAQTMNTEKSEFRSIIQLMQNMSGTLIALHAPFDQRNS